MTIRDLDGSIAIVRLELAPVEVLELLSRHEKAYPGAKQLERAAARLEAEGFQSESSRQFVADVCRWGKGHRLVGRVEDAGGDLISAALREATGLIDDGHAAAALGRVQMIPYLGQSFASKQLRFLRPEGAVILDRVIREHLGYSEDGAGYEEFLSDCKAILKVLIRQGLSRPGDGNALRICDVEAAIYAKLQGY